MINTINPAVVFRRRNGWEAADMGVFLWRKNCFPIFIFAGIPWIILFVTAQITTRLGIEWLSTTTVLFIWWIKPLLDRFILHIVSIRFFEPHCLFKRLFKGLHKTIFTGLFGDLFLRRFSLSRSAVMPLRVLERLKGGYFKRRKQLLARNGLGFGTPLTLICLGMIAALNAGELVFLSSVFNMIQGTSANVFDFINDHGSIVTSLYLFNNILMETLYVCMGFSLYINSRVETEGWDIELLFKTYAEKNKKNQHYKTAFVIPVLALLFLFTPGKSFAQAEQQNHELLKPAAVSEEAEETLSRILEAPEFGTEKDSRRIQFKQKDEKESPQLSRPFESPFPLKEILGQLLRFVVVAAIIAAVCFIVFYAYRHRSRFFPRAAGGKSSIQDPAPEECQKLLQQAEEYHKKGKIREAWALCFKAFLSAFTRLWFVPFPAEATEYESLVLARKNTANTKNFEEFIHRWIAFAYGGQEPLAGSFEQAITSCRALLDTAGKTGDSE